MKYIYKIKIKILVKKKKEDKECLKVKIFFRYQNIGPTFFGSVLLCYKVTEAVASVVYKCQKYNLYANYCTL